MAAYIPYHSTLILATRFELLLSRFVLGCGLGMVEQMALQATTYLASIGDCPHATSVFILCVNLGIGRGSLAARFMSVIVLHNCIGILIFVFLLMYP